MNISFLAHSGFVIETNQSILIFDYYKDPAGVLSRLLPSAKPVLFLVTHEHADHWNPHILDYASETGGSYRYVLEEDVAATEAVRSSPASEACLSAAAGREITADQIRLPGLLSVRSYPSNDEGVAFLVETDEGLIYHAGDLNDWNWGDSDAPYYERTYREALARLKADLAGRRLLLAMVPVDHRLGGQALSGARIFLETVETDLLIPMHLNGDENLPLKLAQDLDVTCFYTRDAKDKAGRPVRVTDVLYEGGLKKAQAGLQPKGIMSLTEPGAMARWPL